MPLTLATPGRRVLDIALVLLLAFSALQLLPLPDALVAALSPNAAAVQARLQLAGDAAARTLSIDAGLTRLSVAGLATALLVFWTARDLLSRGGVRTLARTIAIAGFVLALVGIAQRATAPGTLLWFWTPVDPGARPIGPFVSRNDFAAWLVQASALAIGYTVAHARTHGLLQNLSVRITVKNVLADGRSMFYGGAAIVMILTMIGALSRGAMLGGATAIVVGYVLSRQQSTGRGRGAIIGAFVLLALLLGGIYLNLDAVTRRLAAGTEASRITIWRETAPLVADFPLTGTGLGTYPRAMLIYQRTTPEILFNHAHSEYLQLVAEGGLLLTIPAVIALGAWLVLARRRLRDDHREVVWIRIAAAAGMAGLGVQCLWDATLRMPANGLLFALLAAVVTYESDKS
jgi:O-antigen ligase